MPLGNQELQAIAQLIRKTKPKNFKQGKELVIMEAQIMQAMQENAQMEQLKENLAKQQAEEARQGQAEVPELPKPQLVPAGEAVE